MLVKTHFKILLKKTNSKNFKSKYLEKFAPKRYKLLEIILKSHLKKLGVAKRTEFRLIPPEFSEIFAVILRRILLKDGIFRKKPKKRNFFFGFR